MTESDPKPPEEQGMSAPPEVSGGWTAGGDELPDIVELTPDLVEEEAIRGDFMLRWAAILLAVLLGCGQISDSRTLVHIRSGDHMRNNGFLPAASDSLSFALEGKSSGNISWLFDHVISAVYSAGGATGLTVFKALIAGVIAWLLAGISVSGLPTWWNSICGVIALAACASDLMPITDLATLLGLILLLRFLHTAHSGMASGLIWKVPILMVVWANMDPRAWLGIVALLLFSVGRSFSREQDSSPDTQPLWAITGLSAVALLINPSPVSSALSAVHTYLIEYPALRTLNPVNSVTVGLLDGRTEYFSLLNPDGWDGFEFSYIAGLMVVAIAVFTLFVARDRRELPWAILLAGFGLLAVLTIHELPAAALVAAVVAATVGQRWYQRTFPQEYTTRASEVRFSRAGRAITVFSFALLALLVVTDRVPTRTPVGSGFSSDFNTTQQALAAQFEQLPENAVVLHTRPELGDFLIWSGHRSFIDSRITPFGSPNDPDSVTHRYVTRREQAVEAATAAAESARREILEAQAAANAANGQENSEAVADPPENPAEPEPVSVDVASVHEQLSADGFTHFVVRLSPPGKPDYRSMQAMSSDPSSWRLTNLGSSAAVFAYIRGLEQDKQDEVKEFNPIEVAFRDVELRPVQRYEFAHEPGFYEKHFYHTRTTTSDDLRTAQHFLSIRSTPATAMIALRAASRVIAADPQSAPGYYALAVAYSRLAGWEGQMAARSGGRHAADMRYMQIVMAARQATVVDSQHTGAWNILFQVYSQRGRADQALECLDHLIPLTESSAANIQQMQKHRDDLQKHLKAVNNGVEEGLSRAASVEEPIGITQRYQLVEQVATAGNVTGALELLEGLDEPLKEKTPQLTTRSQLLKAQLLLESGRLQDGSQLLAQLDGMAQQQDSAGEQIYPWTVVSFFAMIGRGLYDQAATYLSESVAKMRARRTDVARRTEVPLPMTLESFLVPNAPVPVRWPITQLAQSRGTMVMPSVNQSESQFLLALADLESGNVDSAKVGFKGLITECGASMYRPLAGIYLSMLDSDAEEFLLENVVDPWMDFPESDDFEPHPSPAAAAKIPDESKSTGYEAVTKVPSDEEEPTDTDTESNLSDLDTNEAAAE